MDHGQCSERVRTLGLGKRRVGKVVDLVGDGEFVRSNIVASRQGKQAYVMDPSLPQPAPPSFGNALKLNGFTDYGFTLFAESSAIFRRILTRSCGQTCIAPPHRLCIPGVASLDWSILKRESKLHICHRTPFPILLCTLDSARYCSPFSPHDTQSSTLKTACREHALFLATSFHEAILPCLGRGPLDDSKDY